MEDFNSKYTGEQVEELLDMVANGEAGSGGITVETDPIFSASPAAGITEEQIVAWNDLDEMVNLLDADVAQLTKDVMVVQESLTDLDTIRSGAAKGATAVQPSDISEFLTSEDLAKVATSGNYNDLVNTPTIPSEVTESTVSGWGFTKTTGTYSKPSGGIPKSDLASGVQTSLDKADNSLQVEKFQEMDIVTVNGFAGGNAGMVYALPHESTGEEDDVLLSSKTVKTINGESIFGEGNIEISEGSGEVGPQGPQGEKGDKGDTGVGVQSVKQTTTSNVDGGSNVVTVTLTNGTKSTFTVKNGSKGSSGTNGTNGKDGADGATFTPSVDSAGNLSWTNNKGLTNPPTVNIKGPKGDKGDAGEGGGGSSGGEGVIQWATRYAPDYTNEEGVINLDPFVVYYGGYFPSGATIVLNSSYDYNEWRIIFYIDPNNSLEVDVHGWANGITPDISKGGIYELSIVENDGANLGIIAHFPTE